MFGIVACLALAFLAASVSAATISKSEKALCVLRLEGEIVEGDLQQLENIASTEFKGVDGESSANDTICLNSPGGNVVEGVRLAEYFYKHGVGTVIDEGGECYSMCAIMFMMGIAQGPEVNFVNRKLHVTAKLGFHRPYLAIDSDELVSARALNVVHDSAVESIMKIMILANNHVPWSNSTMMRPDLVQSMLNHVGADLFYIDTVEKAGRFEIELFGTKDIQGLTDEQAYYACENAFHWQVGLMSEDTDFHALKRALGTSNGGDEVSKLVLDRDGTRIYSVTSGDAGYSEASCLIALKEDYIQGCGYNGMYNVTLGQGQCNTENFSERSVGIPRLATYKPSLSIKDLGEPVAGNGATESVVGMKIMATCSVFAHNGEIEEKTCAGLVSHNVYVEGKRADRYEFIWPTGNKTIISRRGDEFSINGNPALLVSDDKYTLCAINTQTKNRFCFKI